MDLMIDNNTTIWGNTLSVLKHLSSNSVDCVITSPPYYGLRDYGNEAYTYWPAAGELPWFGQLGLETTVDMYVYHMQLIFKEIYRVLKKTGTVWLNINDSYSGSGKGNHGINALMNTFHGKNPSSHYKEDHRTKNLLLVPYRVASALQEIGFYLRSEIIWYKPNPMPEAVKDRPTNATEKLFLLTKSNKYYYDYESIMEDTIHETDPRKVFRGSENRKVFRGGDKYTKGQSFKNSNVDIPYISGNRYGNIKRNKRNVWEVSTTGTSENHYATFPKKLIYPCVIAGCPVGGIILDPFAGTGTVGEVTLANGRNYILIDIVEENCRIIENRLQRELPLLMAAGH